MGKEYMGQEVKGARSERSKGLIRKEIIGERITWERSERGKE
jgi:hypothetical protein